MPSYKPRLDSSGMEGSAYYYGSNPFHAAGFGLPNCTCYAWGRRYEITGRRPSLSTGNADTWVDRNTTYEVGMTQKNLVLYAVGSIPAAWPERVVMLPW